MKINYRILEVEEENHSITVRYFTDILTEELLASVFNDDGSIRIDANGRPIRCSTDYSITIYEDLCPSEDIIIGKIMDSAPTQFLYIKEQNYVNNTSTNLSNVYSLLNVTKAFEQDVNRPYLRKALIAQDLLEVSNTVVNIVDVPTDLI